MHCYISKLGASDHKVQFFVCVKIMWGLYENSGSGIPKRVGITYQE